MLQKIKTILIIVSIIGTIGGGLLSKHFIQETNRLQRNQKILTEEHQEQKKSLVMDKRELKNLLEEQDGTYAAIVDSMKLKIKQLESLTSASSETRIKFKTLVKDSIVRKTDTITKRDTIIKYEFFKWQDLPWVEVDGLIYRDTVEVDVRVTDTIHVANYWKRKGWFIFKLFHKKTPHSDVSNVNPYVNIHVEQSIRRK